VTKAICSSGCILDKGCIRKCPAEAISEDRGVVVIDQKKCIAYGPSCEEACITACQKIKIGIIQPFTVTESYKKLAQKAA
jgi:electron transport complex protein RnfB